MLNNHQTYLIFRWNKYTDQHHFFPICVGQIVHSFPPKDKDLKQHIFEMIHWAALKSDEVSAVWGSIGQEKEGNGNGRH